jgi:hypothetical protein
MPFVLTPEEESLIRSRRANSAEAKEQHRQRIEETRRREAARQEQADAWTRVFATAGLDLEARVQTTRWVGGVGEPEIWIHVPKREASWQKLVDFLEEKGGE